MKLLWRGQIYTPPSNPLFLVCSYGRPICAPQKPNKAHEYYCLIVCLFSFSKPLFREFTRLTLGEGFAGLAPACTDSLHSSVHGPKGSNPERWGRDLNPRGAEPHRFSRPAPWARLGYPSMGWAGADSNCRPPACKAGVIFGLSYYR